MHSKSSPKQNTLSVRLVFESEALRENPNPTENQNLWRPKKNRVNAHDGKETKNSPPQWP